MPGKRIWHLIYGGVFAVLLAIGVLAVATNRHGLWQEVINSARSLVDMTGDGPDRSVEALPFLLGLFAVFSLLERGGTDAR